MDLIISKDYRKFIEDNDIHVSDWNKATLVYNQDAISYSEKVESLCEIKDSTHDKQLREQIEERLDRDSRYLEMFQKTDPNAYYELSIWYKDHFSEEGIFRDFKSAFEAGMEEGERFKIRKEYFMEMKESEKICSVEGAVSFYQDGKVEKILWLYEKGYAGIDINDSSRFEYRYVDLLYRGDKYLSVFSHEHAHPTELEYARFKSGDPRKGFMEYMQQIFLSNKDEGMNEQIRSVKRMDEVLKKIKKVWEEYPDLRLGQLLIYIAGKKDLYMVEDEVLLERLQKNIFPAGVHLLDATRRILWRVKARQVCISRDFCLQ